MNNKIVFPWGGAGNHIRWLMYFDKSFNTFHFSKDKSSESKLQFIETKIYTKERTWHNWLEFEWKHRKKYNFIISIENNHHIFYTKNSKTLIISFNNYTECAKRYLVFTSFNDVPLSLIEEHYNNYDNHIKSIDISPLEKIIIGDIIWDNILDKKFYYDIINFWELEDHYEYAARVHKLWQDCQKRALAQFMEYCKNDEYINFLKV